MGILDGIVEWIAETFVRGTSFHAPCQSTLQPVQAGQRHSAKRRDYRSGQPPAGIPV